ncbi:MAG TPA: NAD(P)H-dependent oxidoreductase [Verrucomicrobiae bacterium]|nr:NAD(P)H-dependent oxidoreductase [Verrucomicrobiae bacterium]
MSHPQPLNVLLVIGSPREKSVTRAAMHHLATLLRDAGCAVDVLDLREKALPPYNPDTSYAHPEFGAFKARLVRAETIVLGSPDYHGCVSSTLKNFLDHFWQEFTGKLIGHVVASHEKGLTVIDQLRTMARQCYAWTMPYAVAVQEKVDVTDGAVTSDSARQRLEMFARDLRVYGALLARQRAADLAGTEPGFLARARKK